MFGVRADPLLMKERRVQEDRDHIAAAIGRIPSGCSILTAQHDGRSTGVLVSWVQQAAFDPPMITVCLKRDRPAAALVEGSGRFVLNLISDDPTSMFKHFGKGFGPDDDAFAGLDTEASTFGPVIPACIGHLGCRVVKRVEAGDHDLYLGEVIAADGAAEAKPYVHLRKNGLSY